MTTEEHKNLLKTLFEHVKFPCYYDESDTAIFDADGKRLLDIRGWGWMQMLPKPMETQDAFGLTLLEFINDLDPNNVKTNTNVSSSPNTKNKNRLKITLKNPSDNYQTNIEIIRYPYAWNTLKPLEQKAKIIEFLKQCFDENEIIAIPKKEYFQCEIEYEK